MDQLLSGRSWKLVFFVFFVFFFFLSELPVDSRGCAHQISQASGRISVSSHMQADYKPVPQAAAGGVCSHSPSG